jgi:type VI secretion system FHA domain protein
VALQLRIISDHRRLLGERGSISFDGAGGAIGRAADNDWVLPDPQRFISAHHARIHHRDGVYILEDISTNGVFINDDDRPISMRGAHVLQNGDIIRFGEYQVVAMVEATPRTAPDMPADPGSGFGSTGVEVVAALGRGVQTDLGASLDLGDLLDPERDDSSGSLAVNPQVRPVPSALELSAALADSETERQAIARRIERLARAASRAQERRTAAAPPIPTDVNSGLSSFCKGAGIAADHFTQEQQNHVLHLAGQLLREALVGLKDLERTRTSNLRPMEVDVPTDADDPRPSLARGSIEDLVVQILSQHESRRLDAVQWLRESIDRAKEHDRATFAALRAAFLDFVARLEPAELEARFGRTARTTSGGASRNWELYTEFFRSIVARRDTQLPRVFVDAFGIAYGAKAEQPEAIPELIRSK